MVLRATRSARKRNSQAYCFLLDGGRPENIAGLPDLERDHMPSPGDPPSRPIHHSPSPTKQQRPKTEGRCINCPLLELGNISDLHLETTQKYMLPHWKLAMI